MTRRRALQGIGAAAILAGGGALKHAHAEALTGRTRLGTAPEISGREIDLRIAQTPVNFSGVTRLATTINGSIPAPTLRLREGDDVTIRVTNRLPVATSIHWYHSHSGFQEMTGMYGALIVEPRAGESIRADRDHAVVLSDWTDDDPMRAFAKLKVQTDVFNFNQPTAAGFLEDVSDMGLGDALAKRRMWNQMRMNPTDLADLSDATLTYLMNGMPPGQNWTALFRRGERVRLRFINGASNSFYDVRIPGLKLTIVHVDGQNVEPVTVDEFRFGPGETYDAVVEPRDDAYTIFAQSMDRTGFARGTLAVQSGLAAPVPALDPPQWLTMADMMGTMGAMANNASAHSAAGHSGMAAGSMADHASHGGMAMDHTQHAMTLARPSQTVRHARSEYGPAVDMRVDTPRTNLDDPGIGLRNVGRRVLTLADLRSRPEVLDDARMPTREIELHLTGNMERYSWSIDGLEFGRSTPVSMPKGERIRVILQNDTMMTHPMHLHGMWSELESPNGELLVRRHTIPVQPAQRISFLTTPHDLGRWAWHCHLLFHMDAGMFREVVVA